MQVDVNTAIRNAEKAVHDALSDLQHLEMTTKRHLDEQRGTSVSLYLKLSRFIRERGIPPNEHYLCISVQIRVPQVYRRSFGCRPAKSQRKPPGCPVSSSLHSPFHNFNTMKILPSLLFCLLNWDVLLRFLFEPTSFPRECPTRYARTH